jgi:hypothetical protein
MPVPNLRRSALRASAILAAGLLTLGVSQGPTSAAPDREDMPSEWLSVAQLRELASTFRSSRSDAAERRAPSAAHVDVVTDPRGDAERLQGLERGARPYTQLADLTRARYKTPVRPEPTGTLRVTTRWASLVNGGQKGVRRQSQVTFFFPARSNRPETFYVVELSNADNRVRVLEINEDDATRIRPESATVARNFGQYGTTDLILSAEWLETSRVRFGTYAYAGQFEAFDSLRASRPLSIGTAAP